MKVQTVVDCRDAVSAALWWAESLAWSFEYVDPDWFAQLKAQGFVQGDELVEVPGGLSWPDAAAIRSGPYRMLFQNVPEPKTAKNRVHWDLHTEPGERDALVARLVDRGASVIGSGRQGPHEWIILADPEGNEFCVA